MTQQAKSGERARAILDEALSSGSYRSASLNERQACARMNGTGMLLRDKSDADLWYPTEKARKLYPGREPAAASPSAPAVDGRLAIWRDIDTINIGNRLRQADQAKVEALKPSFQEIGQKTPITVQGADGTSRVYTPAELAQYCTLQ